MASKQYHVMVLPWLAFGHIIPFLEFSKKLAAKGIRVSFISTPKNLQRLPPIPSDFLNHIKLVEIHLPSHHGLPENCEATIDLELEQVPYLKKACDGLRAPFEKLLSEDLPDLILFDFVHCWVSEVAAKFDVVCAFFSVYSASTLAYIGPPNELKSPTIRTKPEEFTLPPKWFPFPSLLGHEPHQAAITSRNLNIPDMSGLSTGQRFATTLLGCDFVVVRTCREFEHVYLHLLKELYQKPVLPVGLLPPNSAENITSHPNFSEWSSTFEWLDREAPKSLVFVGFGSECKMSTKQVHELAYGIELSKLPFIWIHRKPELPTGFLDRTSDHGTVCLGWAPQLQILAHPAIGGCLYHSGWGSIIESLGFGHPQILMPMIADQGLMAKLLVEKGIGFQVQCNEDGSFDRETIAAALRLVMLEQEGEQLRRRAAEMKTLFADQNLHDGYVEEFVHFVDCSKKKEN